jgi:hypothetical protein
MRRFITLSVVFSFFLLFVGANLAQAATHSAKPPGPRSISKLTPRGVRSGGTVPVPGGRAGVPAHGRPPAVLKAAAERAFRAAVRKPGSLRATTPRRGGPAHGTFTQLIGSASAARGHAYWNGSRWVAPAAAKQVRSAPRLLVPRRPTGRAVGRANSPLAFYSSTQVDSATSGCTSPSPNEASVAQSSDNPNLVVVAAQAFVDSSGNCDDSHAWVFYSSRWNGRTVTPR